MDNRTAQFEQAIWPHRRAAYNFARWLASNDHDAQDIVQEAWVKALQSIHTLRGSDSRPWLLSIVRNTAINYLTRGSASKEVSWTPAAERSADTSPDPEHRLILQSRRDRVRVAIGQLAPEFREALVLREIEGLSYKEIGFVLKIPIGTVMSRLSRARVQLAEVLLAEGADQ